MTPEISDVIIFLLLLKFFSDSSVSVTIWMQAVCEERLIDEILLKEKVLARIPEFNLHLRSELL